MLDHVFITVKDLDRSIVFYETALKPLGVVHAIDYDGKDGPEGHPDLKGFGRDGRVFFWLRQGDVDARAAHIGFVAKSEAEVSRLFQSPEARTFLSAERGVAPKRTGMSGMSALLS